MSDNILIDDINNEINHNLKQEELKEKLNEFQHKKNRGHYSKENEENKMKLIRDYFKTQNKKTIYLRFNPDNYLSKDNIKIKSPWKEDKDKLLVVVDETDWNNRLAKLKEKVDYYLKKKEIKNNSTKYLFYDTFGKSVVKTI